jgi:hypothetical protein
VRVDGARRARRVKKSAAPLFSPAANLNEFLSGRPQAVRERIESQFAPSYRYQVLVAGVPGADDFLVLVVENRAAFPAAGAAPDAPALAVFTHSSSPEPQELLDLFSLFSARFPASKPKPMAEDQAFLT